MNRLPAVTFLFPATLFLTVLLALSMVKADFLVGPIPLLESTYQPPRKIALWASGRGAPQLALQDGYELPEGRGPDDRDPLVPSFVTALAHGDFNGDGVGDIVTSYARPGGAELGIRFGNGRGDFTLPVRVRLRGEEPSALTVADFNDDGKLDILVGYTDQEAISLYLGSSQGTFRWASDVKLGLCVTALAAGDFDGDGLVDLVASTSSPLLALVMGNGRGGFESVRFLPAGSEGVSLRSVRAADLDGDKRVDLVVTYEGRANGMALLYGMPGSLFSPPLTYSLSRTPWDLGVGDFDDDGRLDIVVTDPSTGALNLFLVRRNRTLSPAGSFDAGPQPGPMTTAYLNGDGYLDVAVINEGSNRISVLLGTGDGRFNMPVSFDVASDPIAIVAGRFNMDGLDDLVIAKRGGQSLVISLSGPPTITVTSTADEIRQDGKVTLREAILAANGMSPNSDVPSGRANAPDVIGFDLPEAERREGVFTIRIDSRLGPLPPLTDGGTTVDGSTQAGFDGAPLIVINGASAGSADGVTISSSLSVLRALAIVEFGGNGVKISGESTPVVGNIIAGCVIRDNSLSGILVTGESVENTLIGGTDLRDRNLIGGNGGSGITIGPKARGTHVVGNFIGVGNDGRRAMGNGDSGISIVEAANTAIGGTQQGAGNVISANARHGIHVRSSSGTRIQGNRIGLSATGIESVGNGGDGVLVSGEVTNTLVGGMSVAARNLISGNGGNGVVLLGGSTVTVQGNYIGTDIEGEKAVGNARAGLLIDRGSQNNLIGGVLEGSGNLISGNLGAGIQVSQNSQGNQILGNWIGINSMGQSPLSNGGDGISISGGNTNQIGGNEAGARNIISGNVGDGIRLINASNNRILNNLIGTDATGTSPLPNVGNGVGIYSLEGLASHNVIMTNVIAHNGGAGVKVIGPGIGNRLSQNSIFSNAGLGIDRGGQTLLPRITSALNNQGESITLRGVYPTAAPAGATIEIFLAEPDPSGRGEGRTFLTSAKADAQGVFTATVSGIANGDWITATATDFQGDTSEFSTNVPVDMEPPAVTVITPNGGEAIRSGTISCIRWQARDNIGVAGASIHLSTDGGATFAQIGSVIGEAQSFCWKVPGELSTSRARVRVVARDAAGNTGQDESDGDFTLDPNSPAVTVLVPNGGEIVAGNSQFTIRWSVLGSIASCDVLLSSDGGITFTALAARLPGSQTSYLWSPRDLSTTKARTRVVCTDTAGRLAFDDSDEDFIVDSIAPTVTVLTPNGGEVIRGGTVFKIQWRSSDGTEVVSQDILFSPDGGANVIPLPDARGQSASALPSRQQSFDWQVPLGLSSNRARLCIRVRDVAANETQDCSDADFTVVAAQPGVVLFSPNGKEILRGGQTFTIRWSSTGSDIVAHDLLLSTDGGATFPILSRSACRPRPSPTSGRCRRISRPPGDAFVSSPAVQPVDSVRTKATPISSLILSPLAFELSFPTERR